MNLFKNGIEKEVTSPKVIERLMRDGWTTDEEASLEVNENDSHEETPTEPKKRGRPAKKED